MFNKDHKNRAGNRRIQIPVMIGLGILALLMTLSITKGAADIPFETVFDALFRYDPDNMTHLMIVKLRLPRTIAAALVGGALAAAGALMQGMTNNPLADTGIMGINSGAGLTIAISLAFIQGLNYGGVISLAFVGAAVSAILVFTISRLVPGGDDRMKLVLSGATVSAMLMAVSQAIAISKDLTRNMNLWTMGSVAGTTWKELSYAGPVILCSLLGAMAISRQVSLLLMGEEAAIGLGVSVGRLKFIGTVLVVLLAGTSVAIAGNVGFIGIIIPHFIRFLVGTDYRKLIPVSVIAGALLLVGADLFAKTFIAPSELPVGTVIALLGVPVFLYYARRQKNAVG